jgi:hypothetical protein
MPISVNAKPEPSPNRFKLTSPNLPFRIGEGCWEGEVCRTHAHLRKGKESPDPPIRLEAPVIHAGEEKRTSGFSRLHPHG